MKNKYSALYGNLPENDLWEGCFCEKLAEYGIWDENEFWKLHFDLTQIGIDEDDENISKDLAAVIVKTYVRISSLITAHFDEQDAFFISNLNRHQLQSFTERLNLATTAAFTGDVLDESSFDLKNPLIK
ncbi:MAG: hypothetical protein JO174_03705 [Herbaspirillum sp.]|nr:hypothetical protein [Herbaspirillum sp.]